MIGRDAEDQLRIELDGKAGRQVSSDDDDILPQAGDVGRVREAQKLMQQSDLEILEVIEPVEHHRMGGPAPPRLDFEQAPVQCTCCGESILANVECSALDQLRVLQHEKLRLEDSRLNRSQALFGRILDVEEPFLRPLEDLLEMLYLRLHLIGIDRPVRDLRHTPIQDMDPARTDPLRSANTVKNPRHRVSPRNPCRSNSPER